MSRDRSRAAAPPDGEAAGDDGPRRRRRHTFADLYHQRTAFRFIERSRRWAILSGAAIVISVVSLLAQGLELSIEFRGGVSWQAEMAEGRAEIDVVRSQLAAAGFGDARVSILSAEGREQVRVQADVPPSPRSEIRDALAASTRQTPAQITFDDRGEGGTWSLTVTDPDVVVSEAEVRAAVTDAIDDDLDLEVSVVGADVTVTVAELPRLAVDEVTELLAEYTGSDPTDVTVNTVGPTWGEQVTWQMIQALVAFFVATIIYLSIRFEWKMALSAMAAVTHDLVVVAGIYSLLGLTVSPATVTAFLTIMGFSLYDTVVVFDKFKERTVTLLAVGRPTYGEAANGALNDVLMRSISTSVSSVLPVLGLLVIGAGLLGATALSEFAYALLAGLIVGTYSSLFVAGPLLVWWKEREPAYAALHRRTRGRTAPVPAADRSREHEPAAPAVAPEPDVAPTSGGPTTGAGRAPLPVARAPGRAGGPPRGRKVRRKKRR